MPLFLFEASWRLQKRQSASYTAVDFLKFLCHINQIIPLQDINLREGFENDNENDI